MERLFWWVNDRLMRAYDNPFRFWASMFLFLWGGGFLIFHWLPWKAYGDNAYTRSWEGSILGSAFVALVGTGFIGLMDFLGRHDD